MAFVSRGKGVGSNHHTFGGVNPNSISQKVSRQAANQQRRSQNATTQKQHGYDSVNIPVSQITKLTRQAQEKDHFKVNRKLVPGFIDQDGYKALAKLSGLDPQSVKHQRPGSPSTRQNVVGENGNSAYQTRSGFSQGVAESQFGGQRNSVVQKKKTVVRGSNADPLSTRFTREDVGRIERNSQGEDFASQASPSNFRGNLKQQQRAYNTDFSAHKNKDGTSQNLPKLSDQVKHQMRDGDKLEFPVARFHFKDIEFPDVDHYRKNMDEMKRTFREQQAADGIIASEGQDDMLSSTSVWNLKPPKPPASDLKKPPSSLKGKNQKEMRLEQQMRDDQEYLSKDFNPVNLLAKNSSTDQLREKYADSFNKIHQIHSQVQDQVRQKERLVQYTTKSAETDTINNNYAEMHKEINNMVVGLEQKVRSDEDKFMGEFTDRLRVLHARYRELEKVNIELSSMSKLSADIDAMMKERDELNAECTSIDASIRVKQEEFIRLKKQNEELQMEHDFLESQVGAAELNQFKLDNRQEELSENIKSLREHIEAQETERQHLAETNRLSAKAMTEDADVYSRKQISPELSQFNERAVSQMDGDEYFAQVQRNFIAYKHYMQKKNEQLRKTNMHKEKVSGVSPQNSSKKRGLPGLIRESQDEIIELSKPFKTIFENSVSETKEEIAQRNLKTRIAVIRSSPKRKERPAETAFSTDPHNQETSTAEASPANARTAGLRGNNPKHLELNQLQPRQITFAQFTESDRRNVIQKFLSSQEVLFLIYGLMFPSQTIAAANQALNGPVYQSNSTNQI